jgi:hypothetical protein
MDSYRSTVYSVSTRDANGGEVEISSVYEGAARCAVDQEHKNDTICTSPSIALEKNTIYE